MSLLSFTKLTVLLFFLKLPDKCPNILLLPCFMSSGGLLNFGDVTASACRAASVFVDDLDLSLAVCLTPDRRLFKL